MKEAKPPKIYPTKELPEILMAMILVFWEKHGGIPKDVSQICFTFHDGIYQNAVMPEHLYQHEFVHYLRQGAGEDKDLAMQWWKDYLNNTEFRYTEELMAYREQYKFMKRTMNRPQLFDFAKYLAIELSSQKYGKMCSFYYALGAIISK